MKRNIVLLFVCLVGWSALACPGKEAQSDSALDATALGLLDAQSQLGKQLEIAGTYNAFVGNSSTPGQRITIGSAADGSGSWVGVDAAATISANFYSVVEYDNTANVLYYRASGYTWGATGSASNYYGRIVWTEPVDGKFYFCEIVTPLAKYTTLAGAKADPATAQANNPGSSGCAGFAWSRMERTANQ